LILSLQHPEKSFLKGFCRSFSGCLLLSLIITARAEEGGAGHYAPGSFASFVQVLPDKPGIGAFNYFVYYKGSVSANRELPIAGQLTINVDATSYADSFGAFWVTPFKIIGANYAPGMAIPFVGNDVSGKATRSGVGSVQRSDLANGLGDIEFWPVALSWSALNKDLHVDFFGGIYASTGEFRTNHLANQGLGFWTFEPGLLASYLGQKNGFEFTTYIGYDINTKNTTTDYQSGQVFHIDVTVAQHLPLGKSIIGIGANGFYVQQTTSDGGSGARLGSFEGMTAGVGPVLSYATQSAKWGFAAEVKWLPQISTQNTLKGDYVWFKLSVQF
jgi:hypothetical protein